LVFFMCDPSGGFFADGKSYDKPAGLAVHATVIMGAAVAPGP
jgi:hypothetical protein